MCFFFVYKKLLGVWAQTRLIRDYLQSREIGTRFGGSPQGAWLRCRLAAVWPAGSHSVVQRAMS